MNFLVISAPHTSWFIQAPSEVCVSGSTYSLHCFYLQLRFISDGHCSSIVGHEKELFGKIQSLLSYSEGPLGICIWNTHKMSDTQLMNYSQIWQSGSATPSISHVQVILSCSSQSASRFQASSRKTKVLVLDSYGNRLFTLDLGLPKVSLSCSVR